MSDSNRLQLAYVEEVTLGTTPAISGTTVARLARATGESLNFNIANAVSNEIRTDRMVPDLIQSSAQNAGDANFELSYPINRSFLDDMIGGGLYNTWTQLPYKNNITSDSELANVGSGTGVYTVDANGTNFKVGHLVRATGFTNAANNNGLTGTFEVSASGATTVTTSNSASVAETAPPVGATLQTVGFVGASADITATADGLASTATNFVTLGVTVGMWLKVGGSAAGDKFATAALNDWIRVSAVTATAITADNKPAGWTTDAGTGKTIKIWFGDVIKNGVTRRSFTIEKGLVDITQYFQYKGMIVGQMALSLDAQQFVTGSFSYLGMTHASSGTPLSGSPFAASLEDVLSAMANVGRIAEAGSSILSSNPIRQLTLQVQNNLRPQSAIGQVGLVGVGSGRCDVTGSINCYFNDRTQYDKYIAGTSTSINYRMVAPSNTLNSLPARALICTLPNIEFESGSIPVPQGNTDVMVNLGYRAKYDPTTNSQVMFQRCAYYE